MIYITDYNFPNGFKNYSFQFILECFPVVFLIVFNKGVNEDI